MGDHGEGEKICSLCGDIGFLDALVRCPKCHYRLQHTYCSRYYPEKIDMERWGCEWCIHEEEEEERKVPKRPRRDHHDPPPPSGLHVVTVKKGGGGGGTSSKAVDRWRKLAKVAKMGSGRRYKLLADVLCSIVETRKM